MRVTYLTADQGVPVDGSKGASVHVRSLVQALARRGHDLKVVTTRALERPLALDATVIEAPYDGSLKRLAAAIGEERDGGEILGGEVRKLLLNSACHEALAEIDRRSGIDAIYERYSLWSTAGASFAARRKVPWVLEVNAPLVEEQAAFRDLSLRPVAAGIERHLLSTADAVFVPSEELRRYVLGRTDGRRRVYVTPNGVDLDLFARPAPLPERLPEALGDRFVIAFAGSLKPWHGVEILLEAYRLLRVTCPDAHLLILGDGPLMPVIRAAAEEAGPDAMTVAGAVPHHEVPGWLRRADVAVAPYPPLERFYFSPIKIAEYMAAGLPVVASRIGQVPRMVEHERSGLLVAPGNVYELVGAFRRLAMDAALTRRLGEAARRRATAAYSWQGVAAKVESVLEKLSRRRVARGPESGGAAARLAWGRS